MKNASCSLLRSVISDEFQNPPHTHTIKNKYQILSLTQWDQNIYLLQEAEDFCCGWLFKDSVLLRQYSSFNYDLNRAQNFHIYKFRANTIKMRTQTKYQRNSFVECCDPKTNQTSHHSLLDVLHFDMEYVDFPSANASCIVYNMCVVECVCVRANFTLEENTVTMSPLCK